MKVIHFMKTSITKIEVELTDWRGTPVNVGDHVVYAVRHGSSLSITEGEIIDIQIPGAYNRHAQLAESLDAQFVRGGYDQEKYERMLYHLRLHFKLRVKRINQPGGFSSWETPGKVVTLNEVDRVTVIK